MAGGSAQLKFSASLPSLGVVDVIFHDESAQVVKAFGHNKELDRLRNVAHLGVVSSAITGVNHSRLEYALLQCAVVSSIKKLHAGNPILALGSSVELPGLRVRISSGDELLKSWALLGNFGHAKYTYATERGLLSAARHNDGVRRWLLDCTRDTRLRHWLRDTVDKGHSERFHYALTLLRLSYLPPGDRRKSLCRNILRALLLPTDSLFEGGSSEAQHKLARLKRVYALVRLVSILALDSYYSPQPIRLQIHQIIMGFPDLLDGAGPETGEASFEALLRSMTAWLGEALYLHPTVSAVRKSYEDKTTKAVLERFDNAGDDSAKLATVLDNLMRDGIGPPNIKELKHFLRLSFSEQRRFSIVPGDFHAAQVQLQRDIALGTKARVSVDTNQFSGLTHVDLLLPNANRPKVALTVLRNACRWLVRSTEAQYLLNLRRTFPATERNPEAVSEKTRARIFERSFRRHAAVGPQIIQAVLSYFLPTGWSCAISMDGYADGLKRSVLVRMRTESGQELDLIAPYLDWHLTDNPLQLSGDRLQELRAIRALTSGMRAPLLLACVGKIQVRDQMSRDQDELDGLVLEVRESDVRAHFVEAKNLSTAHQNERRAFDQLADTRKYLRQRFPTGFSYRRRILRGLGASMTVSVAIPRRRDRRME